MPLNIKDLDPNKVKVLSTPEPTAAPKLNIANLDQSKVKVISEGVDEEKGFWSQLGQDTLSGVAAVGNFVDSYAGAPTRAAIGNLQDSAIRGQKLGPDTLGDQPTQNAGVGLGDLYESGKAFVNQFGENPDLAPTGKDIATKAGLSTKENIVITPYMDPVSPAGIAGFLLDLGADPTNAIPGATVAKMAGKAAVKTGGIALKSSAKAAELAGRVVGAGRAVDVAKEVGKATTDSLNRLIKPAQAEDWAELAKIGEENGLSKEVLQASENLEFGENRMISNIAAYQRQTGLSPTAAQNFEKGLDAVRDATMNKVARISGGSIPSKVEAGQVMRDGFDKAADAVFNNSQITYDTISKTVPDLKISGSRADKLNKVISDLETFANKRAAFGVTTAQKTQGADLINTIHAIQNTGNSFDRTVGVLRDIGEAAFKNQNALVTNPPDIARLRLLYNDLREVLFDTVREQVPNGAKYADALEQNNRLMSEFFGNKSLIAGTLGNPRLGPEKVFTSLTNDTSKIDALKSVLAPEDFNKLKGAYIADLFKPTDEGVFSFKKVRNSFLSNKSQLQSLLSPQEFKEMADVVRLGDRYGTFVLNTSQTGVFNMVKDLLKNTGNSMTNEVVLQSLKDSARGISKAEAPGLKLPFGPQNIGPREALFLRLPQQISIQERNKEKQGLKIPGG
jgi:hypothetical protein